jgi:hypothetical protein
MPLYRPRRALVALAATMMITLTAGSAHAAIPAPPGGPILVVTPTGVANDSYYPEILRAEGLNEFAVNSPSALTGDLTKYDTVILAAAVSDGQASALSSWVNDGGNLISMRPNAQLFSLLGLTPAGTTLSNDYIKVDTGSAPGDGIVGDTMQYHGTADRYTLTGGARAVATLYVDASTATSNPAVTTRSVGSGHASAFTYDLAQSVYLTRQGNPAWVGQDHDGDGLSRANDLFQAQTGLTDWLDKSKIQIPQADEQQRLLANLITETSRNPVPRFWYFPRGDKAEVVMTGDDHGTGETSIVFNEYLADDPPNCSVANWQCVRSTSYVYPSSPVDGPVYTATQYQSMGFEVALHLALDNSSCTNFGAPPLPSLDGTLTTQLSAFAAAFSGVNAPATIRTHCIPWSDWDSQPKTDLAHGIRLSTDYYWFSNTNWDEDLAGMFTGSGMPMRFAALNGSPIDVYQEATDSADDATTDPNNVVPAQMKTLIDNALSPTKGYYGAFTVIVHNDGDSMTGNPVNDAARQAVIAYAQSQHVSIISEKQLLDWTDGRDNSAFNNVSFSSGALTFTISKADGANGLKAMLPVHGADGDLVGLTRDGNPVTLDPPVTIKGVQYVMFDAVDGAKYKATYPDHHAPQTTITQAPSNGTATSASVSFASSEDGSSFECSLDGGAFSACTSPKSYSGLGVGAHTVQVRAIDGSPNHNVDPTPASASWTITAPAGSGGSTGGAATTTTTGSSANDKTSGKAKTTPAFLTVSGARFRPGGKRSFVFKVRLTRTARIVLTIKDSHGKVVRTIRVARHKPGTVTIRWNGKDKRGHVVRAAKYRYALTAIGSHYKKTGRGSVKVLAAR